MFYTFLLQNPAFPAAVQSTSEVVIDRAYIISAIVGLVSAIVYLYLSNEKNTKRYTDKMEQLIQDGNEAKHKLSESIDRLNRDSDDRHRRLIDMLERGK